MSWLYSKQNFEIIKKYSQQVDGCKPRYFICVMSDEIDVSEEHYREANVGDTLEVITEFNIVKLGKKPSKHTFRTITDGYRRVWG